MDTAKKKGIYARDTYIQTLTRVYIYIYKYTNNKHVQEVEIDK